LPDHCGFRHALLMLLSVAMTSVALDAMTLQAGKQGAGGKPAPALPS
jgi:hypothetical protein